MKDFVGNELMQTNRERKGVFYTPLKWVKLSQKYMADYFGEDWQEEYYIWDCAAGTGNLLVGLTEPHRIWASTIDQAEVDIMKTRIGNDVNLLESHIFKFDFLNDDFSKCPIELQKILNDEEKRKKLIIYINPPYAEHGDKKQVSGTGKNKSGVATETTIYKKYHNEISSAARELSAQFLIRIYKEIFGCKIAQFSKLKILQAGNFIKFRNTFKAKLEKLFIVPANTFDNVKGKFPIGFFIWDTKITEELKCIDACAYDKNSTLITCKTIYNYDNKQLVIKWLQKFYSSKNYIAYLCMRGTDVQNNNFIYITSKPSDNDFKEKLFTYITQDNVIETSIYYTIRNIVKNTWINDRDQYLYPLPSWEADEEFKTDCLAYTLFNNKIKSEHGINHWIPFKEKEVGAKDCFESHFMTDYMLGKVKPTSLASQGSLLELKSSLQNKPLKFSNEAQDVFDAGRELWKYYHSKPDANPNAALYDIKDYFQGRNAKGRMNKNSKDEIYNNLMDNLRGKLKILAHKIIPKIYEHGFLLK